MNFRNYYFFILSINTFILCISNSEFISRKPKTILTVLLARNKEHTLPYFLTLFSNLNYPKERISLFIRSDHNVDKTATILKSWTNINQHKYHSVDILIKESPNSFDNEGFPTNWTNSRFEHLIALKEDAFQQARKMWADYIWFLDVDAFITDPDTLSKLIEKEKPIIAPMLKSLGTYSNYWCGMTEMYWYERTEEYLPILDGKKKGCFSVPMVHSSVLIDLSLIVSDYLSFDPKNVPKYDGPLDDIITFAIGAKKFGVEMFICNDYKYGFIPSPLNDDDKLSKDYQLISDIKLEALVDNIELPVSQELGSFVMPQPEKTTLNFDHVYLINLARRQDRKERMIKSFNELGIEAEIFEAVDGSRMNISYLEDIGFKQLDNYKDPWSKRDMTYGEIGCFLSHYYIWEDIVHNEYDTVIVFEDDIRFEPFFKDKVNYLMRQMARLGVSWDLVYLGRKKLKDSDEPWVDGSDILVHVDYSYWTLCYIITLQGAKKLLRPQPISKMVPVDEYIPIMFDKHPEEDWKAEYFPRNLRAFSASPLMVFPTHYTGDDGYISDTEQSKIIEEVLPHTYKDYNSPMGPESGPKLPNKDIEIDIGINNMKQEL